MDDPLALRLVDVIGADNMMWSIDYPHPESVYGYTGEITKAIYDTVGHDLCVLHPLSSPSRPAVSTLGGPTQESLRPIIPERDYIKIA